MFSSQEEDSKINFKHFRALEEIERFLQWTDYKFECSEIVWRKFENINDHPSHLHYDSCAEIMKILVDNLTVG